MGNGGVELEYFKYSIQELLDFKSALPSSINIGFYLKEAEGLEECVDTYVYVIREVFDELICDRVWFGYLSGFAAIDCPIVVDFCDVFVKGLVWFWRCVGGWRLYVEEVRVFRLCPWGMW